MREGVTGLPTEEGVRLRRSQEKSVAGTRVVEYQETYFGLPVWHAALRVVLAGDPPQIVGSSSSLQEDIQVAAPIVIEDLRTAIQVQPASLREALGIEDAVLQDY
jgi:Fungalysin/Thermolysin Propeptide Motif